ncbi:TPA_asm: maturation protein [ssRNA phage ESE006]|uniref:Maturation protein n=1 Tax=ssRNA phage ESE006 TaxID=2785996 RepID=A0A8S5KXH1_9VIRU|nr:maturation protein [ssRNA phage ESE006]DAD49880.1 TPA_asm: maturation protein [ssRNA phage ESE006]
MTQYLHEVLLQPHGYYAIKRSGSNSPRVNGVLKLRPNDFLYQKGVGTYQKWYSSTVIPFENVINAEGYRQGIHSPKDGMYVLSKFPANSVLNSLKIQLLGELHEHDVNLAVAYAERTATANLVKDTAGKLLRGARALKKGNFSEAARHLGLPRSGLRKDHKGKWRRTNFTRDAFSQKWLEFSYGWVPLYNDMYGSLVAADKALAKKPSRLIPVSKQTHYNETITTSGSASEGPYPIEVQLIEKVHVKQVMKIACNVRIDNPVLATVQSVGLTNPALVAWELVPFSFVVDWVVPIGSWLTAIAPLVGITPQDVFRTAFSEENYETGGAFASKSWQVFRQNPFTYRYEWRTASTSVKLSSAKSLRVVVNRTQDNLSVSFPQPQFPGAWQQAASALALFHKFMSKAGRF